MKDWTISSGKHLDEVIEMTAYSIGAILGDGHLRFVPSQGNGSCYVTQVDCMDKEIVERVAREVNKAFSTNYHIYERVFKSGTRMFLVRANRYMVYEFFRALTGNKHEVPIEIVRGSNEMKRNFIAGIFDTDGTVKYTENWNGTRTRKNPRWQLGFSNTVLEMVQGVATVLASLGVKVGKLSSTEHRSYRTIHSIFPNIRSFIDAGCYFQAKRKQDRLEAYLHHVLGSETMYTASMTMDDDIVQA